jgi:hypothetical protein
MEDRPKGSCNTPEDEIACGRINASSKEPDGAIFRQVSVTKGDGLSPNALSNVFGSACGICPTPGMPLDKSSPLRIAKLCWKKARLCVSNLDSLAGVHDICRINRALQDRHKRVSRTVLLSHIALLTGADAVLSRDCAAI